MYRLLSTGEIPTSGLTLHALATALGPQATPPFTRIFKAFPLILIYGSFPSDKQKDMENQPFMQLGDMREKFL